VQKRGFELSTVAVLELAVPKVPWSVLFDTLADMFELNTHVRLLLA
jgi:hypothetical protein